MDSAPFVSLARASDRLAATRSRLAKRAILVDLLRGLAAEEVAPAVGWLVAEPACGPLGVGPAQLWKLSAAEPAHEATVALAEVEAALDATLRGGRAETAARVEGLFGRLTEAERAFFVGAVTGSLRQGSLSGVMVQALAELTGQPEAAVRRAMMVRGSLVAAAEALCGAGADRAAVPSKLALFRPAAPMLALSAASIDEALSETRDAQVEWKVDGVRAQVHKEGARVEVYSRQGNAITAGCGPLLERLRGLDAERAILDGEVALVDAEGRARAFQDSFSAVASGGTLREGESLRIFLFDCLHCDGVDLLDEPLAARLAALDTIASDPALRVPRLLRASPDEAARFFDGARAAGHEGVMVKDASSPYRVGSRGGAWRKVKAFVSVDLVVLAVEDGSGRRSGLLSNLHLGARRADGTFCMVGKTFKGLTDALLRWQTERLGTLAERRDGHVLHVRPALVVEVRFNDVQRSPRYPGGVALRFARVVRYREDKRPEDVDTVEALARLAPADPGRHAGRDAPPKRTARQLSLFEP